MTVADLTFSVKSRGIVDDVIQDPYGKFGSQQLDGMPSRSLPLSITGAPEGTVCYAITMIDPDSVPICGYAWVHWLAANVKANELPENASIDMAGQMVQGANDYGQNGYGGPKPPDRMHTYTITVYALNATLPLRAGYSLDELNKMMIGRVLAQAQAEGKYRN